MKLDYDRFDALVLGGVRPCWRRCSAQDLIKNDSRK